MKIRIIIMLAAMAAGAAACGSPKAAQAGSDQAPTYSNPVINSNVPDPTVIRAEDGWFYAYGTDPRVTIHKSRDLVHWQACGHAFTEEGAPHHVPGAGIWAPDIHYVNGRYVLYYSQSVWDGQETACVGRAVASSPQGPFKDLGKLLDYSSSGVKNSIDPCLFTDRDGSKHLFWGSFNGLYMIDLDKNGLDIKQGAKPVKVAGNWYEGVYVERRGRYYYMFASIGSCCEGARSTYKLVVGRSRKIEGPYVNEAGEKMLDNKHRLLLSGNETFAGPGHCSGLVMDDRGQTWLLYHSYCSFNGYKGRLALLDKVVWDQEGWPSINDGKPSLSAAGPFIR